MTAEKAMYLKTPGRAIKALYGNSRANQAYFKCRSCTNGSMKEVAGCEIYQCALWSRRPGKDVNRVRPEGTVPSLDELRALLPQLTDEEKEAVRTKLTGGSKQCQSTK